MEGAFKRIWNARADVPSETYISFMDILMETIRDEIAECSEKAYQQLPVAEAQRLLLCSSLKQLQDYADKRGWVESKGAFHFKPLANIQPKAEIPSMQLIHETLSYAKELERII